MVFWSISALKLLFRIDDPLQGSFTLCDGMEWIIIDCVNWCFFICPLRIWEVVILFMHCYYFSASWEEERLEHSNIVMLRDSDGDVAGFMLLGVVEGEVFRVEVHEG